MVKALKEIGNGIFKSIRSAMLYVIRLKANISRVGRARIRIPIKKEV